MKVREVEFSSLGDRRGSLVALEQKANIPFEIKRVYYIFANEEGISRGFHAHKSLKQVAVCVSGQCKMLLDNGVEKKEVLLDHPTKGVIIEGLIWREMHDFSSDCVLLVIASELFDENDYIRNYDEFLEIASQAEREQRNA